MDTAFATTTGVDTSITSNWWLRSGYFQMSPIDTFMVGFISGTNTMTDETTHTMIGVRPSFILNLA